MSQVLLAEANGVLTITINRPDAKNAISLSMYEALTKALIQLDSNKNLKVGLLKGSEQCFSAGNDLKDFLASGKLDKDHPTVKFLHAVNNLNKPLVAAVAGPAIGIGTTVLLHCDYVIAATNSHFQLPFTQLGVCPELASSLVLPQAVGHQKAFELLVLGEPFTAEQAKEMSLVNQVVTAQQLMSTADEVVNKLAKLPQKSVVASKALLKRTAKSQREQAINAELDVFQQLLDSQETQNIIANFFKR